MKKSRKKLLASITACILAGTMAFNGTLAYLTDTEGAVNISTVGKVNIDLEEPGYPGNDSDEVKSIIPNQEITKDPQVENTGDNSAIVYLKVDVPQETFTELGSDGMKGETKLQDLFALKGLSDNWELIKTETSTDADTQKTKTTYVYAYRKTLDKGAKTDELFEKVQMKNAVENDLSGKVEDIVIQACAIQATDIPDVDLATDENGYLKTGSLSGIYGIFMAQSGDKDVRPADEGNRAQNGKLGKITYVLDGGTLPADALTEYGSDDFGYAPPTPTKQYYSFAGWEPENVPADSTGNVTFTAKWTQNVLGIIQYNMDGGTMSGEKTEYTSSDFGYVPPTPTKKDYKFIGWEPESIPTDSTGNVTFTAKWDANTAELLSGQEINLKMKKLAGNSSASYDGEDTAITAIQRSNEAPSDAVMEDVSSLISTNKSGKPVYAWFEGGTIKWWSDAEYINAGSDLSYLCYYMMNLTDISGLTTWDVSNVTDMNFMFSECSQLTNLTPLTNWDTSSVTDMGVMFNNCSQLTDLTPLENWQTGKVTSTRYMFYGCNQLTDLAGLENWQTGKVTGMRYMFYKCGKLTNLTSIANWNTRNVTNMMSMFNGCSSLTNLTSLANWDTANVTNMTDMFEYCSKLADSSAINNWDITKVGKSNFSMMFWECPSHPTFTKRAGTWNYSTFTPTT